MNREKKSKKSIYDMDYMKKNKDRITVMVDKGIKARWKEKATEKGKSLNRFIIDTVNKDIGD